MRPIGYLDLYLTGRDFASLPVLAIVDAGHDLAINPDEVEAAFEVPLAFLMAPENHQRQSREWNGALTALLCNALWRALHLGRDRRHHRGTCMKGSTRHDACPHPKNCCSSLVPFVLFALWLAVRRRKPFAWVHWDGNVSWLVIAGLVVAAWAGSSSRA